MGLKVSGRAVLTDNASGNIVARRDLQCEETQPAGWLLFEDSAYAYNHEEFTLFIQLEVNALFVKFHDEQVRYLPLTTDSETSQRIVDFSKHSRRICDLFMKWMDTGILPFPDSESTVDFASVFPGLDAVESQLLFVNIWQVAIKYKFCKITSNLAKCCSPRQFWHAVQVPDFNRLHALYRLMLPEHDDMSKASILVDYAFDNVESMPDTTTFPLGSAIRYFRKGDKNSIADCMTHVLERLQANRLHTLQKVLLVNLGAPVWLMKCCMPILETRRKRKRSSSDD